MTGNAYSDDLFGRKRVSDGLEAFISGSEAPQIIAIDAPWGAGKTTFLRMWKEDLLSRGVLVVYFDAYEYDYFEDPFIPLCVELQKGAKQSGVDQRWIESFLTASKQLAGTALKHGVRATARVVTFGAVGSEEISAVEEATSKAVTSTIDEATERVFQKFEELSSTRDAFSKALQAFSTNILAKDEADKRLGLLVIIDELDRCRPDFSIELIECVKHFFQTSGVNFVFGINMRQSKATIAARYGDRFDAQRYLSKFFDLIYSLELRVTEGPDDSRARFIDELASSFTPSPKRRDDFDSAIEELKRISRRTRISLRDIQRIFGKIKLSLSFIPENRLQTGFVLAGLAYLQTIEPEGFERLKLRRLPNDELIEILGLPKLGHGDDTYERASEIWIYLNDANGLTIEKQHEIRGIFARYTFQHQNQILEFLIDSMSNAFEFKK